jgi:hypothetical protein
VELPPLIAYRATDMLRILLILAIFVLLLPQNHSAKDDAPSASELLVVAEAVPLNPDEPAQRAVGPLRWLGSWSLKSDEAEFGGISSMVAEADGSILALSDSATLQGFRVGAGSSSERGQFIAPLPIRPEERSWPYWKWDSESMLHDPVGGNYWVGFELIDRVCRYSPGFARVETCATWPEMQAWPDNGGPEAMARLADGRFLVFSEKGAGDDYGNDLLLFEGDPADPRTAPPRHLTYRPPPGYVPTDAVVVDDRHLLVLNRRVTFYQGFTGSIALVTLPPLRAGALLVGKEIARLAPPVQADNYEALALSRENGHRILWVASDDNHEFFQRTLLLKFALPDNPDDLDRH